MLALLDNNSILDLEGVTIKNGTPENELISRAVGAFLTWFTDIISVLYSIDVICGKGNNGADGFLIAKGLLNRGYRVRVYVIRSTRDEKSKANIFYHRLVQDETDITISTITDAADLRNPDQGTVLIDALLGNGINRPLYGSLSQIVSRCNDLYDGIYAVDSPSGLGDFEGSIDIAMRCTGTLSFEYPKISFFNPEVQQYTGKWSYASIGLDQPSLKSYVTKTHLVQSCDVIKFAYSRDLSIHKGQLGRVLHIIGSHNMKGAGILSAKTSLATGAGVTYGYSLDILSADAYPDIAWINDLEEDKVLQMMDVIVIGPGLGQTKKSKECLDKVLDLKDVKLILDADALNIIAYEGWLHRLTLGTILTPHIGEFNRLFPTCSSHKSRISKQRDICQEKKITILLKGPYTSTCDYDGYIYYNPTGNPSLAKGGSGDILTGIIATFRSQEGIEPHEACYAAAYLHGLAADLYVNDHHESSLTPDLLIKYIDKAMLKLTI